MENEDTTNEVRNEVSDKRFWKNLSVKYWYFILIFGAIIIGAIAGFLLVLKWFVFVRSPFGGNGLWTFDQFSPRSSLLFLIYFFLWELLLVALPALAAGGFVFVIFWFIILPEDMKAECKSRTKKMDKKEEHWKKKHHKKKKHRGSQSGGGFAFLVFVGLCIYIAVDGNWDAAFGTLSIGYFVIRWITVFYLGLIIFGVPAITFGLLWYWKKFGVEE